LSLQACGPVLIPGPFAVTVEPNLRLPRGIRNHNPGNIERDGTRWQGMAREQSDARFVVFSEAKWGIRAIARILITYQDRRRAVDGSRIDTVRKFISRWAPPSENDTDAYARTVARALGVGADDAGIDVYDFDTMLGLVRAIIRYENGNPNAAGNWYPADTYAAGLRLAGIEQRAVHGPVPGMGGGDELPF